MPSVVTAWFLAACRCQDCQLGTWARPPLQFCRRGMGVGWGRGWLWVSHGDRWEERVCGGHPQFWPGGWRVTSPWGTARGGEQRGLPELGGSGRGGERGGDGGGWGRGAGWGRPGRAPQLGRACAGWPRTGSGPGPGPGASTGSEGLSGKRAGGRRQVPVGLWLWPGWPGTAEHLLGMVTRGHGPTAQWGRQQLRPQGDQAVGCWEPLG